MTIRNCCSDLANALLRSFLNAIYLSPPFMVKLHYRKKSNLRRNTEEDDLSLIAEIIDALAYTMLEKS